MRRVTWLLGMMMALVLVAASPLGLVAADEGNRAGLVVQFGDGRVETRCVAFEGDEINGADLLNSTNLDVVIDPSKGMGITVCQIEGEGCDYPSEPCFCQCMGGGECGYWNYYYRDAGEAAWTYSALGALLRQVGTGSVEAWVWGDGRVPPADDLTFEAICAPSTPTPTPTVTPTPTSEPATPAPIGSSPTDTPPRTVLPTATSAPPTSTPMPAAEATQTTQTLSSYWPFGLMVLALVVVGAVVWRRRTGVVH